MLALAHLLYTHTADDLIILPHKHQSGKKSLTEALASLNDEVQHCSTNLTSLIRSAERQKDVPDDSKVNVHNFLV